MKPKQKSPQTIKAAEHALFNAFVELKTIKEAQCFMNDLCTPTEVQAMVDRWQVVPLLKAGKSYRQIHDETGVSVTTIGRVARSLLLGEGGYRLVYERITRKKHAAK